MGTPSQDRRHDQNNTASDSLSAPPNAADPAGLVKFFSGIGDQMKALKVSDDIAAPIVAALDPKALESAGVSDATHAILTRLCVSSPVLQTFAGAKITYEQILGQQGLIKEQVSMAGAIYFYTYTAARDPLLASELILFYANNPLRIEETLESACTIYMQLASIPNSPLRSLMAREFVNHNSRTETALLAGILGPYLHLARSQQQSTLETLKGLWAGGVPKPVPKEVKDLGIAAEVRPIDVDFFRRIASAQTVQPSDPKPNPRVLPQSAEGTRSTSVDTAPTIPPAAGATLSLEGLTPPRLPLDEKPRRSPGPPLDPPTPAVAKPMLDAAKSHVTTPLTPTVDVRETRQTSKPALETLNTGTSAPKTTLDGNNDSKTEQAATPVPAPPLDGPPSRSKPTL